MDEGRGAGVDRPNRSGQMKRLQRRFTARWVAGIAIGVILVTVDSVRHVRLLDDAADAAKDNPAVLDAISTLRDSNLQLSIGACIALALLAVFLFRPLDRTLRREGEWMEEVERTQQHEALRQRFGSELHEALEMAADEPAIGELVGHVFALTVPSHPAELLLADSSEAHLTPRVTNPVAGGPGCSVGAPFDCPAVRRATAQTFNSSKDLSACPHLRKREEPCSALCVPVSFMGRSLGVVHVTGADGEPLEHDAAERMGVLAGQLGQALGTVRAFSKAQLQANTDGLTGLLNRRSAEDQLVRRIGDGESFAIVVADLDHFKLLNDTYGHEVGDRALRLFTDTVRSALRSEDIAARWGGEEFVIALAGADRSSAVEVVDQVRTLLAAACLRADTPSVTATYGVSDTTMGTQLDQLLRLADEALLQAKNEGRDRIRCAGLMRRTDRLATDELATQR